MLGKLLKFDIHSLGYSMLPMYAFLFVVAVISRVFDMIIHSKKIVATKALLMVSNTTHILVMVGVAILFVMLLIMSIDYYRNNIMTDQGYLMHTLPVTPYQLIASKAIVAMFYGIITLIFSYIIIAIDLGKPFWYQRIYTDIFNFMSKERAFWLCTGMLIYIFIYFIFLIQAVYLALNIGYSFAGRLRSVMVVAVCIVAYVVGKIGELIVIYMQPELDVDGMSRSEAMQICIPIFIIYLALAFACYILSSQWLQRRLNLD